MFHNTKIAALDNLEKSFGSMFMKFENLTASSAINDWNIQRIANFYQMFKTLGTHPFPETWKNGTFTPTP